MEYLTDMFCENGFDRKTLQKIINNIQKTRSINNNIITFPWMPKIGPKIKKEILMFRFRVAFQTGPNLKNI